jgi:transporter family-2 protein
MERIKVAATTVGGCLCLAVLAGAVSALQIRINGELGLQINSVVVAALISFAGGALFAWLMVVLSPGARRALVKLPKKRPAWWLFSGGLYGSFFITMLIIATPIIGVAAAAVAVVTGKIFGGLLLDKLAIFNNTPVTAKRLIGAGLAVTAVTISQAGIEPDSRHLGLLVLLCIAGALLSTQAAIQGKLATLTGSPLLVTALSFTLGTFILVLLVICMNLLGAIQLSPWPDHWWLYAGGVLGMVCVAITALAAPIIGVLRFVMAAAVGQFAGALLLDYLLPVGPAFRISLLFAALITIVAIYVAGHKNNTPKRAIIA